MQKFSLQRVLDLKKRREEATAIRLAEARSGADEARLSEATLNAQRLQIAERSGHGAVTVGQLRNASYVIEKLDEQLDHARKAVRSADAQVKACLNDFTAALQERRVLDRLKEKRMEAANAEELRLDQSTMDGIALSRFFRSETREAQGES